MTPLALYANGAAICRIRPISQRLQSLSPSHRKDIVNERAVGRKSNIEKVFAKSFCKSKLFINFVATRGPNGH